MFKAAKSKPPASPSTIAADVEPRSSAISLPSTLDLASRKMDVKKAIRNSVAVRIAFILLFVGGIAGLSSATSARIVRGALYGKTSEGDYPRADAPSEAKDAPKVKPEFRPSTGAIFAVGFEGIFYIICLSLLVVRVVDLSRVKKRLLRSIARLEGKQDQLSSKAWAPADLELAIALRDVWAEAPREDEEAIGAFAARARTDTRLRALVQKVDEVALACRAELDVLSMRRDLARLDFEVGEVEPAVLRCVVAVVLGLFSVAIALLPSLFPVLFEDKGGAGSVYFALGVVGCAATTAAYTLVGKMSESESTLIHDVHVVGEAAAEFIKKPTEE
jgi:hypothetical protein